MKILYNRLLLMKLQCSADKVLNRKNEVRTNFDR